MTQLYEADVLEWPEHQARRLRQHSAGRRTDEAPDWANIFAEIEAFIPSMRPSASMGLPYPARRYAMCRTPVR